MEGIGNLQDVDDVGQVDKRGKDYKNNLPNRLQELRQQRIVQKYYYKKKMILLEGHEQK